MRKVKPNNFVAIQGWMRELNLPANELIAYALVYGHGKNDQTDLSISYIQSWIGANKQTTISVIKKLLEKGLIEKVMEDGKSNKYNAIVPAHIDTKSSPKIGQALVQNLDKCMSKNCTSLKIGQVLVQNLDIPPTPPLNNIKNIFIDEKSAHTPTCEEMVIGWLTDNEDGLLLLLKRCGLVDRLITPEQAIEIVTPYARTFYEQQLMNGGEDIQRRGRRDIKSHFSVWLPIHLRKQQEEYNKQKQQHHEQSNPIETAMRHFCEGWDNAARTKGKST